MSEPRCVSGPVFIRAKHPGAYRAGQWARVLGLTWTRTLEPRLCFQVEWVDGQRDTWPVEDTAAQYEFAQRVSS